MKKIDHLPRIILFFLTSISLTSCSLINLPGTPPVSTMTFQPLSTPTIRPSQTPTDEPTPSLTNTDLPTATDVPPTLTPTPQVIKGIVSVQTLNVREGPGTGFRINFKLLEGTSINILSRVMGNEWVHLNTEGGLEGWAAVSFIELQGSLESVALEQPDFAYLIKGAIVDQTGQPVDAVTIAVFAGTNPTDPRTDATSDSAGHYYAFLPKDEQTRWQVTVVGVGCSSRIMDADCKYQGNFEPVSYILNVPQRMEQLIFTFYGP